MGAPMDYVGPHRTLPITVHHLCENDIHARTTRMYVLGPSSPNVARDAVHIIV